MSDPIVRSAPDAFESDLQWIERNCWIVPRGAAKCRLRFNRAQAKVNAAAMQQLQRGRPVRLIVLKARQLGISTLIQSWFFARSYRRDGWKGLLIAHQDKSTKEIWSMQGVMADNAPHTRGSRRRFARVNGPLVWRHNSRLNALTAGGHGVGHGGTLQGLHLSEASRYGKGTTPAQQTAVLAAVSGIRSSLADTADSIEVVESTANGVGGLFHDEWQRAIRGESDYSPVFIAWFEEPSYRSALGTGGIESAADLDEYEQGLVARFGLDLEQLCWRRNRIQNTFSGDERQFREQFPSTPEEAFLVSGASVFDPERVTLSLLHSARDPVWRGDLLLDPPHGWIGKELRDGPVQIWKHPKKGRVYVIGADVAECLDTASDRDAAVVRDAKSKDVVAILAGHWELGDYARRLSALAWYYNHALLAVERNNTGPAVIGAILGRLGGAQLYDHLFRYRRIDRVTGKAEVVYGFPTTRATKAACVEAWQAMMRSGEEVCPSRDVLQECSTFIHLGNGRMGASAGCRDDLVTAGAISAFLAPEAAKAFRSKRARDKAQLEQLLEADGEEAEFNPF